MGLTTLLIRKLKKLKVIVKLESTWRETLPISKDSEDKISKLFLDQLPRVLVRIMGFSYYMGLKYLLYVRFNSTRSPNRISPRGSMSNEAAKTCDVDSYRREVTTTDFQKQQSTQKTHTTATIDDSLRPRRFYDFHSQHRLLHPLLQS